MLFSSLGQARFLLGDSVPLTSSSLFLPPALLSPWGLIYTHTFPSFFLFVFCFPFSLHISSQSILLHISTCFKLFSSVLSILLCELSILIHYTLYTTSSLLLRRVTTIGCSIDLETDASTIIDSGTCESSSRMFRNRYVHGAPERSIRRKPVDDFAHFPTGETPRSQAMISLKISKKPFRI